MLAHHALYRSVRSSEARTVHDPAFDLLAFRFTPPIKLIGAGAGSVSPVDRLISWAGTEPCAS